MSDQHPRDLLGRPLHDLRISLIDTCNFRCPYCMPAEVYGQAYRFLERKDLLSFEEIQRVVRLFAQRGVVKVKLTGGEPLLRPWVPELVRMLKVVEGIQEVALITNGSLLQGLVLPLRSAGLDRLTVSLDSLEPATFEAMSGHRMRLPPVLGGLASAREAGFSPIKLNVVVMRGVNDHEVVDMARHFRGNHFIPRFIEFMDVGNRNGWSADRVVPSREILARIHAAFPLLPVAPAYRGEVASRYRYADGEGEIGFISSVSQPFCHDCSRIRLSAEGRLYTCLFARDGFDLRGPLRAGASDQEMGEMLSGLWRRRADRYSEERATERQPAGGKVEMYHIGG